MVASIVAVAEIANVLALASSGCDVFVQTHVQFGCLLTQMVDKDGFKVGPIVETCTFTRPEDTSVGACMIGCWDDHCQIRIATLTVDYYDELMRPVAKRPAAAASGKQLPLPAEGEEEEKEAEEDEDGEEEEEENKWKTTGRMKHRRTRKKKRSTRKRRRRNRTTRRRLRRARTKVRCRRVNLAFIVESRPVEMHHFVARGLYRSITF